MTRSTFSRVCGFTVVTLLMTRETVLIETFACAATSRIVAVPMKRSRSARRQNRKIAARVAIPVRETEPIGERRVRGWPAAIHHRSIHELRPRERKLAAKIEFGTGPEQHIRDAGTFCSRQPGHHE